MPFRFSCREQKNGPPVERRRPSGGQLLANCPHYCLHLPAPIERARQSGDMKKAAPAMPGGLCFPLPRRGESQGEEANLHFPIVPVLYHVSVTLSRQFFQTAIHREVSGCRGRSVRSPQNRS